MKMLYCIAAAGLMPNQMHKESAHINALRMAHGERQLCSESLLVGNIIVCKTKLYIRYARHLKKSD